MRCQNIFGSYATGRRGRVDRFCDRFMRRKMSQQERTRFVRRKQS